MGYTPSAPGLPAPPRPPHPIGRTLHLVGKHKDKVRAKKVRNEDTGRTDGFQIEHNDGSVAAVVRPETVRGHLRRE